MTQDTFPPIRSREARDEEIHGFVVRYGWFWNVVMLNGDILAFDPDDVDPCRYGVTDKDAFRNLAGPVETIVSYECVQGWHAKAKHLSGWTERHDDRLEALRTAYRRLEAQRERNSKALEEHGGIFKFLEKQD
ncbi:hypothetical protein HOT99_gp186 [Caulobacter phage CcrBL10]|uniref:Uncharacterized protein n=1 Tax=Caulobacter phage CcrBL10 TaxID=2283269 RepID=A0A385E993_9CAUD|nr:hypothetical protein HOT99_gp186 [Caulobacter phage CcrBL10]AXQ68431.1 hypothetical protein CcrBL10_gp227 [Caulobacter phage CcrBL10]